MPQCLPHVGAPQVLLIEVTTQTLCTKRGGWHLPRAPRDCPREVADVLEECIAQDPQRRPSAEQVLARLQAAGGGDDGAV